MVREFPVPCLSCLACVGFLQDSSQQKRRREAVGSPQTAPGVCDLSLDVVLPLPRRLLGKRLPHFTQIYGIK